MSRPFGSFIAASIVAFGTAAKASLLGAKTVMSLAELRVSPRPASVTAVTRVDSTGLLLAAVATGSVAMPENEPLPSAGTAAQPAPNGLAAMSSVVSELELDELRWREARGVVGTGVPTGSEAERKGEAEGSNGAAACESHEVAPCCGLSDTGYS